MFNTVAIIGVGLIGGSLGLEIKKRRLAKNVLGVGRTQKNLKIAIQKGCIDKISTDLSKAVTQSDLIVLCAPVLTIESQLKVVAQYAKPGTLVTDVGSTKKRLVEMAEKILPPSIHFVGSHPMAGTEKSGAMAVVPNLFQGKKCLLTPTKNTSKKAISQITQFWEHLGLEVYTYAPKQHDELLAMTSHFPQMVAYTLIGTLGSLARLADIRRLSGGGLMDTTRIAASNPEMWRDICLANSQALVSVLKKYQKEIVRLVSLIEMKNAKGLDQYFEKAAKLRRKIW